jgi:hypothetical protein
VSGPSCSLRAELLTCSHRCRGSWNVELFVGEMFIWPQLTNGRKGNDHLDGSRRDELGKELEGVQVQLTIGMQRARPSRLSLLTKCGNRISWDRVYGG